MENELTRAAKQWFAVDPDDRTRNEIELLLASERPEDAAGLADRFGSRLKFGTAGLRGPLGAGPNRMNRVVVRQATAALMANITPQPAVVIGYDARHNSEVFALDAAAIVASCGGRAVVLPGPLPTPVLAYAVRYFGADAGVMVTASHNPPQDNGFKVYLSDGAQLITPLDRKIEAAIAAGGLPARELPAAAVTGSVTHYAHDIVAAYLDDVFPSAAPNSALGALKVVYTPLHGVGRDTFERALARWGCTPVVVASQSDPNPDFPTVAFPNPEEPGAMDAAVELASEMNADVIVGNDPDADRLAIAVPQGDRWRHLTGDEVGALLAEHVLGSTSGDDRLVVTTLVSSSLLAKQAAAHNVRYAETLTGFKWVVRPALEDRSSRFVFGYEEALGYSVNDVVRDKDGIAAAVCFLQMLAQLRSRGRDALTALDDLASKYGRHVTRQVSMRVDGPDARGRLAQRMATLRTAPPRCIGGRDVIAVTDYLTGETGFLPSDILRFDLDGGGRVMLRPSGTEPKLKIYFEWVQRFDEDDPDLALDDVISHTTALID